MPTGGACAGDVRLCDFADARLRSADQSRPAKRVTVGGGAALAANDNDAGGADTEQPDEPHTTRMFYSWRAQKRYERRVAAERWRAENERRTPADRYPMDMWHCIGAHVQPADVLRFALVCRTTWRVTNTAAFWRHLYYSYCKAQAPVLPVALQSVAVSRPYALRARVIRALFLLHESLKKALTKPCVGIITIDAEYLKRGVISEMWSERVVAPHQEGAPAGQHQNTATNHGVWHIYFKFIERGSRAPPKSGTGKTLRKIDKDGLSYLDDIFANPHSGSFVLKIVAHEFAPLPGTGGWVVRSAAANISRDMRNHFVRLTLTRASCTTAVPHPKDMVHVTINSVKSVHMTQWWHPDYPLNA